MTGNRLIDRRTDAHAGGGKTEHCPAGYSDPQAWCDWRNANKTRASIKWVVGNEGTPICVDDEEFSAQRHAEEARVREEERRRFNWRQMHPIEDQREAAE